MILYVLAFFPQRDLKVLYSLSYFSSTRTVVRAKEEVWHFLQRSYLISNFYYEHVPLLKKMWFKLFVNKQTSYITWFEYCSFCRGEILNSQIQVGALETFLCKAFITDEFMRFAWNHIVVVQRQEG